MGKHQPIHDALTGLQQLFGERLEELLLADCLPHDVKARPSCKFGEDRQNRSSIAFEEWVRVSQVSEDLSWVSTEIVHILAKPQGMFCRTSAICGMGEEVAVSGLGDGDRWGRSRAILSGPWVEGDEDWRCVSVTCSY